MYERYRRAMGRSDELGFQRGTGFLLSRLGALVERSWRQLLGAHGLTQSQYAALQVLLERGSMVQGHLADEVAIDQRNVVAVVDSMVKAGLAERQVDQSDARRRLVVVTPRGRRAGEELAEHAARAQIDFLSSLTEDEQRVLNRLLAAVYDARVSALD
jgi:DNA-binding MarR family transcriptional regulator